MRDQEQAKRTELTPAKVADYYWQHSAELTPYAYFHFLTRLALIADDPSAQQKLRQIYDEQLQGKSPSEQIEVLDQFLTNLKQPLSTKRQAYLTQYPEIRPFAKDAFMVLFARRLWQLDLSATVLASWSTDELNELAQQLLTDREAVVTLATYAINFEALFKHFFEGTEFNQLITSLYEILDSRWDETLQTEGGIQTLAYFVTHLIINDSLFYTREVPTERRNLHASYLRRIEALVQENGLDSISVDCHCELQLCFKMLSQTPKFHEQVRNYVTQFKSAHGDYLVEPNKDKDLSAAEHTNVLYILAF